MTESSEKQGVPILIWILGGCGCAFLGLFVLGLLAAIALPSFLNQANKAREAEAKTYVGAMARGEQAYFIEKGTFTSSISALGIGVPAESMNYRYTLAFNPSVPNRVLITAVPKKPGLRSIGGAVFTVKSGQEATTISQICETERTSLDAPTDFVAPSTPTTPVECPTGSRSVTSK